MSRDVFQAGNGFKVPDETYVFPFLNSNDVNSGLAPGLLDDFSLAIGEIDAGNASKIHVHPVVTHVTMVLDGRLDVRRRDETTAEPYTVQLAQHQAALARPGVFQQLINVGRFPCRTLYVVGPAYVFDADDQGEVLYDDAVTLEESWDELAGLNWRPPRLRPLEWTIEARTAALERIRRRTSE